MFICIPVLALMLATFTSENKALPVFSLRSGSERNRRARTGASEASRARTSFAFVPAPVHAQRFLLEPDLRLPVLAYSFNYFWQSFSQHYFNERHHHMTHYTDHVECPFFVNLDRCYYSTRSSLFLNKSTWFLRRKDKT